MLGRTLPSTSSGQALSVSFWFSVDLSPDYDRGVDQIRFAASVYVSLAYGFASWAGGRLRIRLPVICAPRNSTESPSSAT